MVYNVKSILAVLLILSAGEMCAAAGKPQRPRPEWSGSVGTGGVNAGVSFAGNSRDVKRQVNRVGKEFRKGLKKLGKLF